MNSDGGKATTLEEFIIRLQVFVVMNDVFLFLSS